MWHLNTSSTDYIFINIGLISLNTLDNLLIHINETKLVSSMDNFHITIIFFYSRFFLWLPVLEEILFFLFSPWLELVSLFFSLLFLSPRLGTSCFLIFCFTVYFSTFAFFPLFIWRYCFTFGVNWLQKGWWKEVCTLFKFLFPFHFSLLITFFCSIFFQFQFSSFLFTNVSGLQ